MPPVDASLHDTVSHLYQDHHDWLQGWLRRCLGCAENAVDLAQDIFARLFASRRVLDAREPRAYLTTITRGLTTNQFQRQPLERVYLDALADFPEDPAPPPEQRLMVSETLHEVGALSGSLSDRVRQTFLLTQIEGLKYGTTTEHLGASLDSVKRYMRQTLRQCLELME